MTAGSRKAMPAQVLQIHSMNWTRVPGLAPPGMLPNTQHKFSKGVPEAGNCRSVREHLGEMMFHNYGNIGSDVF